MQDMAETRGSRENPTNRVENQLKVVKLRLRKFEEKRVAVVNFGKDEGCGKFITKHDLRWEI